MCYPVPGPRCSAHAYKELVEAEKKFVNCTDPSTKLLLGASLEEKQNTYDSTPRGQNDLRRAADLAEGLEKEELLLRLRRGEEIRKQQLDAYHAMLRNKKSRFTDSVEEKGYVGGRYQDACGIAAMFLADRFPSEEFHVADLTTIISDTRKVLVLAEKYVNKWGSCVYTKSRGYQSDDILLNKIFQESINLPVLSPNNQKLMFKWFVSTLNLDGYTHFAAVNRKTEDTVVLPLEEMPKLYSIKMKLRKRIGGSTNYRGNVAELLQYLVGTPFEEGKLIQPEGTSKTVIYGVPPQAKQDCVLTNEIFLSWRDSHDGDEGYFEIRRKHVSENYDVIVQLNVNRNINISGIQSNLTVPVDTVSQES